jgi:hypothetical protein
MQIKKQTAFMPLYAPCFLRKTSTCAEKGLYCSHNDYVPRVLRMTKNEGMVFFVVFSLHRGTIRSVVL